MKPNILAFFSLFTLISFFGTGLIFSLLSPPVYGQQADAWNIHRQGIANDLNFYYDLSGLPALQLNTNGNAQIRSLLDMDNTQKNIDPSGTTNLSLLNVTYSGITSYFDRTYTAALNYSYGASVLVRATTAGDMVNGFGPTVRFDIQDNAGITNFLAHIGAIRDGADNSGAIIFRNANAGTETEKMRISPSGNVGIGTSSPISKLNVDGDFTQSITHGNNMKLWLSAARNTGGTGEVGLYSWISEPGVTWTGGGIARNMYNQTGFPRINTGLSGQMLHFTESGNVEFTTETAAGSRNTPLTVANNGSVGIGTTLPVPGSKLDVQIASNAHIGLMNWNNSPTLGGFTDGFAGWTNITIAPAGNVGFGTANPTQKVEIYGNSASVLPLLRLRNAHASGWASAIDFHTDYGGTSYSTAQISSSASSNYGGQFAVQVSNLSRALITRMTISNAGDTTFSGSVTNCTLGNGSSSTACSSDIRLKKDVKGLASSLSKINSLRPITFKWSDPQKLQDTHMGFIAQEVESLFPDLVKTGGDGYKMLEYGGFVTPLVKSVQELSNQLNEISNKLFKTNVELDALNEKIKNQSTEIELLKRAVEELRNK